MRITFPLVELRALFRKSPAFRQVYLADVATQLGDGGLLIAFPLLILERTGDVTLTGLAFSGEILAFGLLSTIAGSVADRLEQKPLMMGANLARVGIFVLLLAALAAHLPTAIFLMLSFALGAVGAFFVPARAAFLRRLLEAQDLEQAIALEGTTSFLLRLVSPPLMGVLLGVFPATVGIQVDMACYLLAAALLGPRQVAGRTIEIPAATPGAWREGWRVILGSPMLRRMLAFDVLLSLAGMAAFSITVALLADVLRLPAQDNAWLLATTGLAGALGTRLAGWLSQRRWALVALTGAIATSYMLVPAAGTLPTLLACWSLRGLAVGAFCVMVNQRIAREVEASVMGRVQAAWGLAACLAAFMGSAATPLLLRTLGPAHAFSLFGLLLVGAIAVNAALSWRLPRRVATAA